MIQVKIRKGKDLNLKFINQWDKIMLNAFGEDNPLRNQKKIDFADDIFFITSENNKLLSVGRLRPVKLIFNKKKYNLLGIADIASIIKGKGYGKILMNSMLKYLKSKQQTGIGFCLRKNSLFYEKSKFKIAKDLAKLFVHKTKQGKLIVNNHDNDVIYMDGNDRFMKRFLLNPRKVFTSLPHW